MTWEIHHADVLAALREMPTNHFDGCLSDVPYGLGSRQPTPQEIAAYVLGDAGLDSGGDFMGKEWQIPSVAVWREIVRVVKPGAPVFSFAGSRTCDLISIGMRAAGLELRDTQIHWVYATGFPKSLNISKAIDSKNGDERPIVGPSPWDARKPNGSAGVSSVGLNATPGGGNITSAASAASAPWSGHGTALKPAYEPCIVAMKPLDGTFAENALKWGVAGLAIDGTRIGRDVSDVSGWSQTGSHAGPNRAMSGGNTERSPKLDAPGRWPANITLDEAAGAAIDAQSGDRPGMSGGGLHRADYSGGMFGAIDAGHLSRNDNGGASRFFFCAKASRFEREFGCEDLPLKTAAETVEREEGSAGVNSPCAGAGRTSGARNNHPCVKPLTLTQYLGGLALPPPRADGQPRRLLVPYAGSGSEMIGALRAGWEHLEGIERDADYLSILRARITRWLNVPKHLLVAEALAAAEKQDAKQFMLFGDLK